MSKKLSYKGQLPIDTEERISLATLNGKTGYRIKKFEIISSTPGVGDVEIVAKVMKDKDPNIGPTVNLTDSNYLAVIFYQDGASQVYPSQTELIFDNETFNQDIYINISSPNGSTIPFNYYLELESMALSDLEATMLTLKNIRTITS